MQCCKTGLQDVNTNRSACQGGMITRCPLPNDKAMLDLSLRQLSLGFSGANSSFIYLHHSVPKNKQKKTIPPQQRRTTCWPASAPSNSITTSPMKGSDSAAASRIEKLSEQRRGNCHAQSPGQLL
jgi:hypothetical protein